MNTSHNTRRMVQKRTLALYLNRMLPTGLEQIELDRKMAVRACGISFLKDTGVALGFGAAAILIMVISAGC